MNCLFNSFSFSSFMDGLISVCVSGSFYLYPNGKIGFQVCLSIFHFCHLTCNGSRGSVDSTLHTILVRFFNNFTLLVYGLLGSAA